jgi:hypothetical protein
VPDVHEVQVPERGFVLEQEALGFHQPHVHISTENPGLPAQAQSRAQALAPRGRQALCGEGGHPEV